MKVIQRSEKETEERNREKQLQKESAPAAPRSPMVSDKDEEEDQGEQPDLVTLRTEYATHLQQLAQLDARKQAGQWVRLDKQVQAAEARLRLAEQDTSPSQSSPPESSKQKECAKTPEYAKQSETLASEGEMVLPAAEDLAADERQAQLHAISSELLYWKGGLKVLRQAQLPKWRGYFKWQIEAKIEALQTEYARLRAEAVKLDG